MGLLTHAEMVTEALELAGNTGLTTRAQKWLGLILRRLNLFFTFPQTANVKGVVVVAAAQDTFTVGRDAGADILNSVQVNGISRALITEDGSADDWQEIDIVFLGKASAEIVNLAGSTGRPRALLVETDTQANYEITIAPIPDKAYRILLICDSVELNQPAYSGSIVNPYPDDLTVVQGVYAMALRHQQDERAASEWSLFEDMEKKGRVRFGNMNKANSKIGLGGPHKNRDPNSSSGSGWMGPV